MKTELGYCDGCDTENVPVVQNATEVFWMGAANATKRCADCQEVYKSGPMRDEPPDETPGIVEQANAAWDFKQQLRRGVR